MFILYNYVEETGYLELICVSSDYKKLEEERKERLIDSDRYKILLEEYANRSLQYYEEHKERFKKYWMENADAIKNWYRLGYVNPEIIRSTNDWIARLMCEHIDKFIEGASTADESMIFIRDFVDMKKLKSPLISIPKLKEQAPPVGPIYNENALYIEWIKEL